MQLSKEELLKKIRAEEVGVLVYAPGPIPKLKMEVVLRKCALCQQVVHMAADNVEAAKDLTPICGPCYMTEFMTEQRLEDSVALMGGQQLSFKEGIQVAIAMIRSDEEGN